MSAFQTDVVVRLALWLRFYDKTSSDAVVATAAARLYKAAKELHSVGINPCNGEGTLELAHAHIRDLDNQVSYALSLLNRAFNFEHCLDPCGQAPYVIFRPVNCRLTYGASRFGVNIS